MILSTFVEVLPVIATSSSFLWVLGLSALNSFHPVKLLMHMYGIVAMEYLGGKISRNVTALNGTEFATSGYYDIKSEFFSVS